MLKKIPIPHFKDIDGLEYYCHHLIRCPVPTIQKNMITFARKTGYFQTTQVVLMPAALFTVSLKLLKPIT
jgi:hypothetical protein